MTALEFNTQISGLQSTLKQFTYRFTRDAEESQDLIQDTLLRALTYRDKFKEDTNLKGWLFTIMRNTFINNYRKAKLAKTSTDSTKELYYLNVADQYTFNKPEKTLELKELWGNINSLKEDLQMPFKLHTTGYKYHEISAHLNIPIGTVKNRIFQARKEIQKNLLTH
ncbi:MAG: RNA polymerase sigma factor [Cyclobacteriaceae bacterium]|jgi:RNA polymerase sigma factor (sigma-70 family)|nr:RNA polymerase sigma factor [Cyclobacteriaceae bacterium]